MEQRIQFQNALAGHQVPAVEELRAKPVVGRSGDPIVIAGSDALVARLKRVDGGEVALRILASGATGNDQSIRYHALAALQETNPTPRLPAAIQVLDDGGPRFDGETVAEDRHPVAMEWIAGPTLAHAVQRALGDSRSEVLRALASATTSLLNDLTERRFIHGDITAHNTIIRHDGQLALVDLDTASWPGAPLGPVGSGSAPYRHPLAYTDATSRDLFAGLVIVTSLLVLADRPDLRLRHGDDASSMDGALLFPAWDLADPITSSTFGDARRAASASTGVLLEALQSACLGDERDIRAAWREVPGAVVTEKTVESTESVQRWDPGPAMSRLRAHYGEGWAVSTGDDPEPVSTAAPNPTWPTGQPETHGEAPAQAATIADLQAALEREDAVAVIRESARLEGDPRLALYAAEIAAVLGNMYDRRIASESRNERDDAVLRIAEEAATRQVNLGAGSRSRVRRAAERKRVRERLEDALAANDKRLLSELAVSGELVALGDADRETVKRVLQAIEWPALLRSIQTDDDLLILAAFDAELYDEAADLDPEARRRVTLARERVEWLNEARAALRRRDSRRMRSLVADPPEGSIERLSAPERRRFRQAIEQDQAIDELVSALDKDDDAAIVSLLNKVERVSARIPDRATWRRIQEVIERVSLIDEVVEVASGQPIDHARAAQLIPAVKAARLEHDPRLNGGEVLERLQQHVIRMAHLRRIEAAITRDNDIAIITAAVPDPHGALDLLSEQQRNRVAQAIRARRAFARTRA